MLLLGRWPALAALQTPSSLPPQYRGGGGRPVGVRRAGAEVAGGGEGRGWAPTGAGRCGQLTPPQMTRAASRRPVYDPGA